METLASESAVGTSSAQEAGRCLGLSPSSIRNIFQGVLNQYPFKLQSCHELLRSETIEREAFARKVSRRDKTGILERRFQRKHKLTMNWVDELAKKDDLVKSD
ncbi:hypothetical protein NPIL_193531 [Nephila pilipes]|uniref:Uncharacterized protein n=1 Tax=Nephila pilipes TaxID=299642 RepID=A0A8X6J128_NEPPI|nr:hypothetical protein NPIL_193531 [Nephila pilipes]